MAINPEKKLQGELKCRCCPVCAGFGCIGELPGMGGVYQNHNFIKNCESWKIHFEKIIKTNPEISRIEIFPCDIRCGPVTGAAENVGCKNESDFYFPYLNYAAIHGYGLCIGDGFPDEKLFFGLQAVQKIKKNIPEINAAFFLKPYPDEILQKRANLVKNEANFIGIDIDSYNILTMRNSVHLEKKTSIQLLEFRKKINVPFVLKGVFTNEDIDLVKSVKPEVVYISNHGGRVETKKGSTADFLAENSSELKKYCKEIWIDGGIRTKEDAQVAKFLGADKIIAARPFIRKTFFGDY